MENKKIKLLHFHAPLKFGGGEVFLKNFYQESANYFEHTTILFSFSKSFEKELARQQIKFININNKDLDSGSMKKYLSVLFFSLRNLEKIKVTLSKLPKYDYIVGHGFPFSILIPLLKVFRIISKSSKIIHFQHSRLRRPSQSFFWRLVYKCFLSHFNLIIINSSQVSKDIFLPIPTLKDKLYIFPTAFSFKEILALKNSTEPDKEKNKKIKIVYAARHSALKNHQLLIEIAKNNPQSNFIIKLPGIGPESELGKLIKKEGINDKFILPGEMAHQDTLRLIAESKLCLFPSLDEGFGLGLLESLALGKPTIAFDGVISEELSQFAIKAKDKKDFVTKSRNLITNPQELIKAERALQQKQQAMEQTFDIGINTTKLYQTLKSLL